MSILRSGNEYGISRDQTHAKLAYTWYGSWTTIYNLYADSLLCFHLPKDPSPERSWWFRQKPVGSEASPSTFIPDKIYKMQSDWYYAVLQNTDCLSIPGICIPRAIGNSSLPPSLASTLGLRSWTVSRFGVNETSTGKQSPRSWYEMSSG